MIYEVFSEWGVTKQLLLWLPTRLEQALGISGAWSHGLIKSMTLFVGLPAVLWLLPYGAFRLVGGRLALSDYLLRFGVAFIPIMAAAHAIKALLKTTSRIPYWKYTLSDPIGADTARGIIDKTLQLAPLPIWRDSVITVFSLALMSVAVMLSLFILRKLIKKHISDSGWRSIPLYLIPGIFGGAFFVQLIVWRVL